MLLEQGEADACGKACREAQNGYQPAFVDEYPLERARVRAHGGESRDVVGFFHYEHRQRTENIEGDDYYHKEKYQEDHGLLDTQHPVQGLVLLFPAFDLITVAQYLCGAVLYGGKRLPIITAAPLSGNGRVESQFDAGTLPVRESEQVSHGLIRGYHVTGIERGTQGHRSGREKPAGIKGRKRVYKGYVFVGPGKIQVYSGDETGRKSERMGQTPSRDYQIERAATQLESPFDEGFLQVKAFEISGHHSFQPCNRLLAFVVGKDGLIEYGFDGSHSLQGSQSTCQRIGKGEGLPQRRLYEQIGLDLAFA